MTPLWGMTDAEADRPNWINLSNYPVGTTLIFVDEGEAQTEEAKLKGIKGAGWYLYYEYQNDADPAETRYKTELVVAARKTFGEAGDDVADDTILTGYTVYITTQPVGGEVIGGAPSPEITVVAASNPDGVLTYQWEKYNTGTEAWDELALETTDTLAIAVTAEADSGDYRVVITAADTTTTVTSEPATLTVLPS